MEALTFLAEGVDVSVLERVWQIGEGTLRTWLTRVGLHTEELHEAGYGVLRASR